MKVNESGRSMIEMLGVLAIIGVLSVGGIAGYTKAMAQHKINKTVEQISQIVGNIRTLYFSQKNYSTITCVSGTTTGCPILKKGHAIPDEMWTSDTAMENAFGGAFSVKVGGKKATSDTKAFTLVLGSIPEEACMAIATYDWGSGSSSGLVAVGVNVDIATSDKALTGCAACVGVYTANTSAIAIPKGTTVSVPMPADKAAGACQNGETNTIYLKFY